MVEMVRVPDTFVPLFEQPVLFNLATLMPDGQPQVTPVWGLLENGNLKINTAIGRQKDKNMRERPQATVLLVDPENGQNWIEVRCRVANRTTDGADAEIDALAKKYLDVDTYPYRNPAETRVSFTLEPIKITHA